VRFLGGLLCDVQHRPLQLADAPPHRSLLETALTLLHEPSRVIHARPIPPRTAPTIQGSGRIRHRRDRRFRGHSRALAARRVSLPHHRLTHRLIHALAVVEVGFGPTACKTACRRTDLVL
jgi:hypothetical protein